MHKKENYRYKEYRNAEFLYLSNNHKDFILC